MRSTIREKDIQNQILAYLKIKGIFCWNAKTQGTFDPRRGTFRKLSNLKKGVSDILGILPSGRLLAIEVKRPGGRVSPEQKDFIKNINDNNGLAFVAYSLEDVIEKLKLI